MGESHPMVEAHAKGIAKSSREALRNASRDTRSDSEIQASVKQMMMDKARKHATSERARNPETRSLHQRLHGAAPIGHADM